MNTLKNSSLSVTRSHYQSQDSIHFVGQKTSPLATFHPKLPVRLNLCASAKCAGFQPQGSFATLWSSIWSSSHTIL